ncbi:MAG: uroporphyrinogen decarboxylase family protein [Armatimonadota bacterium]
MSFADGWAAINLEMPERVPRTEYSVDGHWDLIRAVTGIEVSAGSPDNVRIAASSAFRKAWNWDLMWSTLIGAGEFGNIRTNMGHAVYAAEGVDWDENTSQLFDDPDAVLRFDPLQALGPRDTSDLTRRFEQHYRANCIQFPDMVNMTGIYVTIVSGLIDLFGWEMLLSALGVDPEGFGQVTNRYASWIQQYYDALAEADVPVVMVHDDIVWTSGAFVHPEWYRRYVFPNYRKLFRPLIDSGKKILYTSDGSYTEFIDDIAECGVHGFVLEPTTDMGYIAQRYGRTHAFIGNADTRILLSGTKPEIRSEVERCMSIGKDCPGFMMAVGNHIPANTPVDNAIYYNEVYTELSKR